MTFDELKAVVVEWKLAHDADREGASADKYFRRIDAIDNLWNAAIDLLDERYGEDGWHDL